MRVIDPEERKTTVELSDRELQLVERALFTDKTNEDENADLYEEFRVLRRDLRLSAL